MTTNETNAFHHLQNLLDRYFLLQVLSPETAKRYELSMRNLTTFIGGPTAHPSDIGLDRLDEDCLVGFRNWSLKRMKPISVNTERRHVSTLLNAAVRYGWISANPFRGVPSVPVSKPLPKAITRPDMLAYLDFLRTATMTGRDGRPADLLPPQWFWYTVLSTMYFTGMRRRQLIGLRWRDVNFQSRTIRLAASSSKTRREWDVPLPPAIEESLWSLRVRTVEVVGTALSDRQVFCLPLFSGWATNFRCTEMRAHNMDAFFKRLATVVPVELGRLSAHRVRHTTATVLANSVPNLRLVQEQLGHQSIVTTYGYVHSDLSSMRSALAALSAPNV